MSGDNIVTASGEVLFFWDSDDDDGRHMLVNIDGDDHHKPDAFELVDEIRDSVVETIAEGVRIEIDYTLERLEMVNPDGATTFGTNRPKIIEVRIFDD